jgi:hypothetical protein
MTSRSPESETLMLPFIRFPAFLFNLQTELLGIATFRLASGWLPAVTNSPAKPSDCSQETLFCLAPSHLTFPCLTELSRFPGRPMIPDVSLVCEFGCKLCNMIDALEPMHTIERAWVRTVYDVM